MLWQFQTHPFPIKSKYLPTKPTNKKNAHIQLNVCQVYKGEIEEKLLTDYSNQLTGRIMHQAKPVCNLFSYKISYQWYLHDLL